MAEQIPIYINILFIITTVLTVWLFYKACGTSKLRVLWIIGGWLLLLAIVAYSGFFLETKGIPPRFSLIAGIPVLGVILLFLNKNGRKFLDALNPKILTVLHVVRVPVEIALWLLFLYKAVPQLMTFEGRNYDILAGITAPLVAYFGYIKMKMGKYGLLVWNIICLGLLFNIVGNAILAIPSDFQYHAFDQPNIAILYFPFVWLPGCVVPLVLLAHLATIRNLLKE